MSDLYLNQHDADQKIIDNLLRQLRRIKPMAKYFKDVDGKVYKALSYELVEPSELQQASEALNQELGNVNNLLQEPAIQQKISEDAQAKAEEQRVAEQAEANQKAQAEADRAAREQAAQPVPVAETPIAPVEQPAQEVPAAPVEQPVAPPVVTAEATETPADPLEQPAPVTLESAQPQPEQPPIQLQ